MGSGERRGRGRGGGGGGRGGDNVLSAHVVHGHLKLLPLSHRSSRSFPKKERLLPTEAES
jgi:hypothetical protein